MHPFLPLFTAVLLWLQPLSAAERVRISVDHGDGDQYMNIRLLGTVSIPAVTVDGQALSELSGLAWDEDEALLYAISDKGRIFHLRPRLRDGLLVDVAVERGYALKDREGKRLKKKRRDAEGLAAVNGDNGKRGDTELVISFETRPRIARFTPRGKWLGKVKLPPALRKRKRYHSKNKSLEAVTVHPEYGVITTPERPLLAAPQDLITLYGMDGRQWRVRPHPAAGSAPVALESLPDGTLLMLERAYASVLQPFIVSLRRVWLDAACGAEKGQPCRTEKVADFSTAQGWSIDNFEGLTRHRGNRFFIVSDNNNLWFQRTLLSYFEILEAP